MTLSISRIRHSALLVVAVGLLGACSTSNEAAPVVSPDVPVAPDHDTPLGSFVKLPKSEPAQTGFVSPVSFAPLTKHNVKHRAQLHPIEGALLLSTSSYVGRVAGEKIEWLNGEPGSKGESGKFQYDKQVKHVYGRWPDAVDMVTENAMTRTSTMTFVALTSKSEALSPPLEGGANVLGTALVGETALAATTSWVTPSRTAPGRKMALGLTYAILTTRGPELKRAFTAATEAGCKVDAKPETGKMQRKPKEAANLAVAVTPRHFSGTRAGTLISIGSHCSGSGIAAEVWDKDGKARIVDLTPWLKEQSTPYALSYVRLLPGSGDTMWIEGSPSGPLLHYHNGKFAPVPALPKPMLNSFVSDEGQLHASDGDTIYRYAAERWQPLTQLAWPTKFSQMALYRGHLWVQFDRQVARLQSSASFAHHSDCKTPFVWLRNVEYSMANHTFDNLRSTLGGMPGADSLRLSHAMLGGVKRLGIRVRDEKQGRAVLEFARAKLAAKTPAEEPRLMCAATPADAKELHFISE